MGHMAMAALAGVYPVPICQARWKTEPEATRKMSHPAVSTARSSERLSTATDRGVPLVPDCNSAGLTAGLGAVMQTPERWW